MKIILKEYLEILHAREVLAANGDPHRVPGLGELAEALGVTRTTISRFANNKNENIPVDLVNAVIGELRQRGFKTELHDIAVYVEGNAVPADVVGVGV